MVASARIIDPKITEKKIIEGMTVEQWLAIRKEEALKIDPDTAEVLTDYGETLDPYGVLDLAPRWRQYQRNRFARRPGSDMWIWSGDLPKSVLDALYAKHASVEEWLAIRKEEALKIDPETAEVKSCDALTLDPYAVDTGLPEERRQAGMQYFARRPGSNVGVWFGDLPEEVRDALWAKHRSKLAIPNGILPNDHASD
jgi:hypothetical protein